MLPHLAERLEQEVPGALGEADILDHDQLAVDDFHRRHEPLFSLLRPVVSPVGIEPTTT